MTICNIAAAEKPVQATGNSEQTTVSSTEVPAGSEVKIDYEAAILAAQGIDLGCGKNKLSPDECAALYALCCDASTSRPMPECAHWSVGRCGSCYVNCK
jgi:hypothetical protein